MDIFAPAQVANIGTNERRKRLVVGIGALAVGLGLAVVLVRIDAPALWRLPLFVLFFVAAVGFFQSRDKT
jgi:hypothetical protein